MIRPNISALFLLCLGAPLTMNASSFQVSITDTLQSKIGFMAFDLLGGSPVLNNLATVTGFGSNSILSAASHSGAVTGTLVPGPLNLADTSFFNEWLQGVSYGTTISFVLTTGDATSAGGIPDSFSFFLLDNTRNPFPTSDPSGANSLFSIDLNGSASMPDVFTSAYASATVTPVVVKQTPEPSSLALLLIPLAAWGVCRRFPQRRELESDGSGQ